MERVTGIGGFFFRTFDPERSSAWYAKHLGVDGPPPSYDTSSWWQQPGPTFFAGMQGGEHFGDPARSWSINFRVTDLDAMVDQLRDAGIQVKVDPEAYPNGRFASLRDRTAESSNCGSLPELMCRGLSTEPGVTPEESGLEACEPQLVSAPPSCEAARHDPSPAGVWWSRCQQVSRSQIADISGDPDRVKHSAVGSKGRPRRRGRKRGKKRR